MGLEITGYRRRTFDEILSAKISKAKELFGETINTDENTPLGKFIRINAYDQYQVEELAEKVYYSIFPQTAIGTSLDRLGWLLGISREPAMSAVYEIEITGSNNASIPAGFLVGTESGAMFYTTISETIGTSGSVSLAVECTQPGEIGNVVASDINTIINPAAEIDTVKGIRQLVKGVERESDVEFREKFSFVKNGQGSTNEASIRAALVKIPTVEDAIIDVDEVNHKFTCYLKGGENYHQTIAETIFDKKPLGITTEGTISVPVSYGALTDYIVKFSHITAIEIYVKVTLTTNTLFESNGNNQIKSNVMSYINSIDCGHDLIFTALYSPVYQVPGVVSAQIQISTDNTNWITSDITTEPYEGFAFRQISINEVVI